MILAIDDLAIDGVIDEREVGRSDRASADRITCPQRQRIQSVAAVGD
jgi:hypothetical protein